MAEVNAMAEMNRLLTTKPPVLYWVDLPPFLREAFKQPGPAAVRSSLITEVQKLVFDDAKLASLPELVLFTQKKLLNCGDANVSSTVSLSLTGARSWSVTKTSGVSTTMGATITGSYGIQNVGSVGMSLSWSQTISSSTSKTEGYQETISRTMTDTISVGPRKAVNISLKAYQATIEIPFESVVVVEGDLVENVSGLLRASALLSKAERTFPIKGVLRITDVSEASVRTDDLHGSAGCEGGETGIKTSDIPQAIFEVSGITEYLKSKFTSLSETESKIRSSDTLLKPISLKFADLPEIKSDTGPEIGPPDGTRYEILYTSETAKPTVACGFNDLGVPNTGIFTVEARQYRTYTNGTLIAQWQESVETFKSCWLP